jgi:large subunit ribosomal protein L30
MTKVRITLVKSLAKRSPQQRATVKALGLGKTNSTVEKELSPAVNGMIAKVKHLIKMDSVS